MEYFKKVATAPDASASSLKWDFSGLSRGDVWAALFSFLYLDFLDCTGTLFSMVSGRCGVFRRSRATSTC